MKLDEKGLDAARAVQRKDAPKSVQAAGPGAREIVEAYLRAAGFVLEAEKQPGRPPASGRKPGRVRWVGAWENE